MPQSSSSRNGVSNENQLSANMGYLPDGSRQRHSQRQKSTESLEDWEVVDTSDAFESGESSRNTTSELSVSNQERPSTTSLLASGVPQATSSTTVPPDSEPLRDGEGADRRAVSRPDPATTKSRKKRDTGPELFPCTSCGSYHYTEECVYLLSWTDWLEYHNNFMPSQPYPFSYNDANDPWIPLEDSEIMKVRKKAEQLDLMSDVHRPNYLAGSRLKADLMTKSGREMWYEDEDYRARRRKTRRLRGVAAPTKAAFRSPLEGTTGAVEDDDDDNSEDELSRDESIQSVRTELSKTLPRTSTATLAGVIQRERK